MAEGHEAAEADTNGISSAVNAPLRKRRSKSHQLKDLLHFNALPDRLRDNEYITKYYRVKKRPYKNGCVFLKAGHRDSCGLTTPVCTQANYNAKQTVRSLFGLHNETANIWSHLIGASRDKLCP